jgi:hypothetical protein
MFVQELVHTARRMAAYQVSTRATDLELNPDGIAFRHSGWLLCMTRAH